MELSDFQNIPDTNKAEHYDQLYLYMCDLWEQNFLLRKNKVKNDIILRKEVSEEITNQLTEKYNAKLLVFEEVQKKMKDVIKKRKKQIKKAANWKYRDSKINIEQKKLEIQQDKINIMREAIKDVATLRRKQNPILGLSEKDWSIRKKIYPMIIKNPASADSTLAQKTWVTPGTIKNAKDELTASWDLLNSKIDLVKRIVTRSALTVEKAQDEILQRLSDDPSGIEFKDLLNAIKNNAALYSTMVWQATDVNGGILQDEDDKMLQEVLSKNLK